jgi:hypothetical protein
VLAAALTVKNPGSGILALYPFVFI